MRAWESLAAIGSFLTISRYSSSVPCHCLLWRAARSSWITRAKSFPSISLAPSGRVETSLGLLLVFVAGRLVLFLSDMPERSITEKPTDDQRDILRTGCLTIKLHIVYSQASESFIAF